MRLCVPLTIAVVVMIVASTTAFAEAQWPQNPRESTSRGFTVQMTRYQSVTQSLEGYYYYQWWVTLNTGAYAYGPDRTQGGLINDFTGFAFELPREASIVAVDSPTNWSFDWSFYPPSGKVESAVGAWKGNNNEAIPPGRPGGYFVAGIESRDFFADNFRVPVQVHVRTNNGTGFVQYTSTVNGDSSDFAPIEVSTPELSTWAPLGCTALFGFGYMEKRRTA